jgi:hypothetical protein
MQQQYLSSVTVAELKKSLVGLRADSVIVFRCRSSEDKQLVFSRYESRGENLWIIELTEIEREQRGSSVGVPLKVGQVLVTLSSLPDELELQFVSPLVWSH